jgi:hypothetical protein
MGANPIRLVDWAKVERQYRAGLLSVCEIARQNNTIESTIRMRAQREGWKRDLTDEMRQTTRNKLVENLANVYSGKDVADSIKSASDEEIIEQASRTQVQVVRSHQGTLSAGHNLVMRMLGELDATTTHTGELVEMIKSNIAPSRQAALQKIASLPGRAQIMRDLAIAAKTWVILERQAFNIADDRDKGQEQRKLDEMTAEQLRTEIMADAKKLGLELTSNDFGPRAGVSSDKTTH